MISTRSAGLLIDTVVCLTLAKWETVSGRFGGYLRRAHLPSAGATLLRQDRSQLEERGTLVLHRARSRPRWLAKSEGLKCGTRAKDERDLLILGTLVIGPATGAA